MTISFFIFEAQFHQLSDVTVFCTFHSPVLVAVELILKPKCILLAYYNSNVLFKNDIKVMGFFAYDGMVRNDPSLFKLSEVNIT